MKYPNAIEGLIEHLRKYPGIGKKTAERYALYTVNQLTKEEIDDIVEAYLKIKEDIFHCSVCGNITDIDPCPICTDDSRDQSQIIVVEEAKDIIAMEKANQYQGLYHVLNGVISPSEGIGPDDIHLKELLSRCKDGRVNELIIATDLDNEGETTARYISRLLSDTDLLVTRIAHGIPAGGNIEYADEITIMKAIEGRRKL
ncbi:MAG: recombination mediator RecR [Candidatus Izimaplasma sp.]|nr:recombination mediator RecR [Candidatus Izimaplasma bacterium]